MKRLQQSLLKAGGGQIKHSSRLALTLAGGGVATWSAAARIKNEVWLERSIGAGLAREMLIDSNEPARLAA